MTNRSINTITEDMTEEKFHYGSIAIALGLIFLFAGNSPYLNIANNYFFFMIAITLNILLFIFKIRKFTINYTLVIMFLMAYITYTYECGGMSDFGTSMSIIMCSILVISCLFAGYNKLDLKIIKSGLIISSFIFSVLVLFDGTVYEGVKVTYVQNFGNHMTFEPNFLGFIMLCGCEIGILETLSNTNITKFKIFIYIFISGIITLGMLKTGSRSTLVSIAIFLVCIFLFTQTSKTKRKLFYILLFIFIVSLVIIKMDIIPENIFDRLFTESYDDGSNSKRISNWSYGIKAMLDHWIIGNGPKPTSDILYQLYGYTGDAHNTFITFGVWYGIMGFLVFILYIVYLIVKLWIQGNKIMVALLISMIFEWNIIACNSILGMWIIILICNIELSLKDANKKFESNIKNSSVSEDVNIKNA